MKLISILAIVLLSGCASQQLAQQHWNWLTAGNSGVQAGYTSGVTSTLYTVNGQSFQVTAPAR
jgi:hypothetical protein